MKRFTVPFFLVLLALGTMVTTAGCKKKEGCTDPNSLNYDPEAKKDDGSCVAAEATRKILWLEFSAAWCPPCGSWGNDAFHAVIDQYGDQLVSISSHGSFSQPDGMTNKYTDDFKNNFPITGWPNFYIGSIQKGTSTNVSADITQINGQPIEANGVATYTIDGGSITVKAKGKFFEDTNGDFYLGIYVMEDGIPGDDSQPTGFDQEGDNSTDYVHNNVLRAGAVNNTFGESLASGNVGSGTEKDFNYSISINNDWNVDNIYVIGIIWNRVGGTYEYVNAWNAVEIQPEEE